MVKMNRIYRLLFENLYKISARIPYTMCIKKYRIFNGGLFSIVIGFFGKIIKKERRKDKEMRRKKYKEGKRRRRPIFIIRRSTRHFPI